MLLIGQLNRDDGGLLPDAYLKLVRKKGKLISEHINKSDSRFAVARFCQSLPMIQTELDSSLS